MKLLAVVLATAMACGAQEGAPVSPPNVGVKAGRLVKMVPPVYPPEAKAQGIEGIVLLKAEISKEGRVENLAVVAGPEMLRDAAVTAVSQWVYEPYTLNGKPTSVDTKIVVRFKMEEPTEPRDLGSDLRKGSASILRLKETEVRGANGSR